MCGGGSKESLSFSKEGAIRDQWDSHIQESVTRLAAAIQVAITA